MVNHIRPLHYIAPFVQPPSIAPPRVLADQRSLVPAQPALFHMNPQQQQQQQWWRVCILLHAQRPSVVRMMSCSDLKRSSSLRVKQDTSIFRTPAYVRCL